MKGYNLQLGQETWKQLEKIHGLGYSNATIFSDFIDTCLFSLLSLTDNIQHIDIVDRLKNNRLTGKYEEQYLKVVAKYRENKTREAGNRPIDYMVDAWGSLLKETSESEQDILGEIFMTKVSLGEHEQFFTPSHLADIMAQMVYSGETTSRKTVSDPCCGSGRFFISVSKINKNAHFYGVDLSPTCAKMTALNMWLFDLDADIYHGDSLAMRMYHVWKIQKGGFIYEAEVQETEQVMPELVRVKLREQAEQQKLFEFDEVSR